MAVEHRQITYIREILCTGEAGTSALGVTPDLVGDLVHDLDPGCWSRSPVPGLELPHDQPVFGDGFGVVRTRHGGWKGKASLSCPPITIRKNVGEITKKSREV